jgi:superfamily II DNA or RNA helicase
LHARVASKMSKKCTIVIDDEVNCRVAGLSPADLQSLQDKFAVFVDGYFFMPLYQLGRWDGKVRFFDKAGKTFTKLLPEILNYLCGWNYDIELDDRRLPQPVIETQITEDYFAHVESDRPIKIRPYQVDVVNALIREGSGFAICATGAGKTIMCAALASVLLEHGLQTIVIVPSSDLVTQTADTFRACGLDVGEFSGALKQIDKPIVVATWQSMQNAPYNMKFFQAVIVDESHGVKANVVRTLINDNGQHIAYRFGVTGTFPLPEADQYALKTSIGRIVTEVTARWLMDNGYLAEVEIEPIEITEPKGTEAMPDYMSEKSFISKKQERLELIAGIIKMKAKEHGNTLVLVNGIQKGRELSELIEGSVFLYGESEKDLRAQNYKQYADRDDVVVIASEGIASTGISIDRIFCEILVDAGKSFIKAIQSVGRGLRRAEDKNKVLVVDIYSSMKWSKKHFKERKKHYTNAQYPVLETIKLRYK